jgi:hypothetical protein
MGNSMKMGEKAQDEKREERINYDGVANLVRNEHLLHRADIIDAPAKSGIRAGIIASNEQSFLDHSFVRTRARLVKARWFYKGTLKSLPVATFL